MPITSRTTPSKISAKPNRRGASGGNLVARNLSLSVWKNWKIVKPKPINESEVRTTDISVRSELIRVRSRDMAVRFDESSKLASSKDRDDPAGSCGKFMLAVSGAERDLLSVKLPIETS